MKPILIFALMVLGSIFSLAQERTIEKAEFDSALKGTAEHKSMWKGQLYRITTETSARISGKPDSDYSATIMIEFGPDPKRRTVHTSRHGGKTTNEETLLIGDLSYSRTNGGAWRTTTRSPQPTADGKPVKAESPSMVSTGNTTYFLVGKKPFKEAMATVYRKVENSKNVNAASGVQFVSICTSVYWLVDGVQRKHDLSCENRSPTLNSTNVVNMEWDLDPTIVFNAP